MARILLADDDEAMRGFLKASLEKDGHTVISCEDGQQALTAIDTEESFDLLLTDIIMPNMDGLELSQKVKKAYPSVKILFITGFAGLATDGNDADKEIQVISKPFHLKDIVAQVNETLAK